jgi:hypothetical protein
MGEDIRILSQNILKLYIFSPITRNRRYVSHEGSREAHIISSKIAYRVNVIRISESHKIGPDFWTKVSFGV